MKRFVVFAGESCYPSGGWYDRYGLADTLEEAEALENKAIEELSPGTSYKKYDWSHIVDLETGKIIE